MLHSDQQLGAPCPALIFLCSNDWKCARRFAYKLVPAFRFLSPSSPPDFKSCLPPLLTPVPLYSLPMITNTRRLARKFPSIHRLNRPCLLMRRLITTEWTFDRQSVFPLMLEKCHCCLSMRWSIDLVLQSLPFHEHVG